MYIYMYIYIYICMFDEGDLSRRHPPRPLDFAGKTRDAEKKRPPSGKCGGILRGVRRVHFCFRQMGLWREIRYMLVLSMHFFSGPACGLRSVLGMMRMEKVAGTPTSESCSALGMRGCAMVCEADLLYFIKGVRVREWTLPTVRNPQHAGRALLVFRSQAYAWLEWAFAD